MCVCVCVRARARALQTFSEKLLPHFLLGTYTASNSGLAHVCGSRRSSSSASLGSSTGGGGVGGAVAAVVGCSPNSLAEQFSSNILSIMSAPAADGLVRSLITPGLSGATPLKSSGGSVSTAGGGGYGATAASSVALAGVEELEPKGQRRAGEGGTDNDWQPSPLDARCSQSSSSEHAWMRMKRVGVGGSESDFFDMVRARRLAVVVTRA